jgi:hypothetical protein
VFTALATRLNFQSYRRRSHRYVVRRAGRAFLVHGSNLHLWIGFWAERAAMRGNCGHGLGGPGVPCSGGFGVRFAPMLSA